MNPASYQIGIIRPIVDRCEWVISVAVVRQPRWNQLATIRGSPEVRMTGQQDAQQSASRIFRRVSKGGSNFPVNVFSLPGAASYQHNCN